VVQIGTRYTGTIDKLVRLVGEVGRVVLVEASPENFERLSEHIKMKSLDNAIIIERGAWSEKKKHRFILAKNPLDNRIEDENIVHDNDLVEGGYVDQKEIEFDTVDNMMKEIGVNSIDFISITVNGAELEVLKGMEHMLDHTQRLYVKAHARHKETNRPINIDIVDFLNHRGFEAIITNATTAVVKEWGEREGDVFAWRRT
jgi:FkbM family methyltransferase